MTEAIKELIYRQTPEAAPDMAALADCGLDLLELAQGIQSLPLEVVVSDDRLDVLYSQARILLRRIYKEEKTK